MTFYGKAMLNQEDGIRSDTARQRIWEREKNMPIQEVITRSLHICCDLESTLSSKELFWELYSAANDPRPQMIPKLDRK